MLSFFKNKSIKNSIWMVSEKLISIFGLIFVMSLVAKYIGPDNFGKLSFVSSIFFVVQTVAMLGLNGFLFQKTSKNKLQGEKIIHVTNLIRNVIYIPLSVLFLIYIYIYMDDLTFIYALATSIGTYFLLHDVYSIYFNALLISYINVICNSLGLIVALVIRYLIVKLNIDIEWLGLPIIFVSLIPYLLKKLIYNKNSEMVEIYGINKQKYRKIIIGIGGKLVLYSLSVAIFIKTSQILLGYYSQYDLGIYTVASTLGTSYYFVLIAMITSFMPEIYQEKDKERSNFLVCKLNLIIIIISLCVLLFVVIFGEWIVITLYGESYMSVINILSYMVLVCMFSGISTVSDKYLLKYNAYDFLKKKTNILLVINILISVLLVHFWRIYGAVFSILITEFLSATLLNYFYRKAGLFSIHRQLFSKSFYKKLVDI